MSAGSYDYGVAIPAPQYDPDGPALQICTGCGQALPNAHLGMCPTLRQPAPPAYSEVPAETLAQVEDAEKKLGEAV